MKQEINIPKLGSEMKTGQILAWHVKVGDHVEEDQELCDKVSEILQSMIDDGTLYDLTVEYFGEAVADSTSIYQK